MNRIFPVFVMLAMLLAVTIGSFPLAGTSVMAEELLSPQTAARLGLEEVWRRQMRVPHGASSIVDQQIIAATDNPREYVEVVSKSKTEGQPDTVLYRIATDSAGPTGEPIGKEEAERLARREVRRLKRRVEDPIIESRIVPKIFLFTLADNGTVDCRDAETGTPVWMSQIGNHGLTYGKMGIDDNFVTITNGMNLIKLDATNGDEINSTRTMSVPLYGSIHAGDFALIPTISNGVEGYPLADTTIDPFMKSVSGMTLAPPTKSPSSSKVAWGTDSQFVYVMELSGKPNVQFRLNSDGIVSGRIAAAPGNRFFFGCESGQVYGIHATRSGEVLWSQPFGEPFYKSPYLIDGMVLLPSAYGNLYSIGQKTGDSVWARPVPGVDRILGGFDHKLFVRLLSNGMATIDVATGKMLDISPTLQSEYLLTNRVSDRLYFVNSQGTVQCVRPIGKFLPTMRESNAPAEDSDAAEDAMKNGSPDSTKQAETNDEPNPFGIDANDGMGDDTMDNIFGDPAGDDKSPFGSDF